MKKSLTTFIILMLLSILGIWLSGFFGGLIAGFCFAIFLLITVGRWLLAKSSREIDAKIHSHIKSKSIDHDIYE